MKLVGRGFSVNGRPNLKGVVEVREDDGNPTGVEWDRDLSNDKHRQWIIDQLQREFFLTEDQAKLSLRELIRDLQRERDQVEALAGDLSEKESKPEMSARFSGLVDLVEQDGEVRFLIIQDDGPSLCDSHQSGGKLLVPPPAEQIQWLLPKSAAVFHHYRHDTDVTLYHDLLQYLNGVSQLPTQLHYHLLVLWLIHSYLLKKFLYSPYIYLWAVPERGKSRTSRAAVYASYRGLVTETLQEANLFRWSNDLGATLALDVRDLWRKAEKRGSEDILLQRFEKGAKVARVLWPERGKFKDTAYYDVFGATIIAANELPREPFNSRCIVVTMPEASQQYAENVKAEDGLPFRERLSALRMRWLNEDLPSFDKPVPGRLGDMLQPLGQVAAMLGASAVQDFLKLAHLLYTERMEDRSASIEAKMVSAVGAAWDQQEEGKIGVEAIKEAYNLGLRDDQKISPDSAGRRLKALGFTNQRLKDRRHAIIADDFLLDNLKSKYGLNVAETSDPKTSSFWGSSQVSEVPKWAKGAPPDQGHLTDTSPWDGPKYPTKTDTSQEVSEMWPHTRHAQTDTSDTLDTSKEPLKNEKSSPPEPAELEDFYDSLSIEDESGGEVQ